MTSTLNPSWIDKSLGDLEVLIERKRADLKYLDGLRKTKSPSSFILTFSPGGTNRRASNKEEGNAVIDKENTHSNIHHILSSNNPVFKKNERPVLGVSALSATSSSRTHDTELAPAETGAGSQEPELRRQEVQTQTESQTRMEAQMEILTHMNTLTLKQMQTQTDAKNQEETDAQTQRQTQNQNQNQNQNQVPEQTEENDLSVVDSTINTLRTDENSQHVVASMNAAMQRIEELQRYCDVVQRRADVLEGDRSDYGAYIQRLTHEKAQLIELMEKQRAVIDDLNAENKLYSPMNSPHLPYAEKNTLKLSTVNQASNSSGTGSSNKSRRRIVRHLPVLLKASHCAQSSPDGAEVSPFLLAKLSPKLHSPDAPDEHTTLAVDSSPNSIFIIRQKVPSPILINGYSTSKSVEEGVSAVQHGHDMLVTTGLAKLGWPLHLLGGVIIGGFIALMALLQDRSNV